MQRIDGAAIAAKVMHPERTVICFAGDGCFLMSGQEMATVGVWPAPAGAVSISQL